MRTARCVANQTVPSNNTTPRSSSAAMATARCRGETMEVTRTVVWTRVKIAASVIATMRMVVRIEAMIRFMVYARDRRIAQWAENQNVRQAVDVRPDGPPTTGADRGGVLAGRTPGRK